CSMDDVSLYGEVLHTLNFSNAVRLKLLVDYKVIVLAIGAKNDSATLQKLLTDQENMQLHVTDASKIVGCWKALAKFGLADSTEQGVPMQRAVAFCQVIEPTQPNKTHKVSSKHIRNIFQQVVTEYVNFEQDNGVPAEQLPTLECKVEHVDGSMGASKKQQHLDWLRAEVGSNECRILSNVRCLAEGVDVPALDAVLFLSPRQSQVEVVQSVGRVMRRAPGKQRGYVILPVVIPEGMDPAQALDDNKVYAVVWQVLQALRAHDDRFDAVINKLDLLHERPDTMEIVVMLDAIGAGAAV
ncbi:damage-inducible protein, partial [Achromatium sp. WMS2]